MKIVIVRHGQTDGNVQKIIHSRTDGSLTELGIQQAKEAAEKLKSYSFDKIYCSTLGRCRETLRYVSVYHQDTSVEYSDKLIELGKGDLEGQSWDKLPVDLYSENYIDKRVSGGESWLDLENRLRSFLNDIYSPSVDTVLVVTHEGPLKVFHSLLADIPLKDAVGLSYNNAGIYELNLSGKLTEQVQ